MADDRVLNPVQVRYSDDGSFIYVSINPREVLHNQVSAEEILEALLETGFSSFEYQLESDILDELTHLPWSRLNRVIIRRIAYRVEFDLKVQLSPDRMTAQITVNQAYAQEQISRERLLERLSHAGVKAGLDEQAIEAVLANGEADQLEIARGVEPVHGRDGWLEFLCPVLDLESVPLVQAGMPLLRRHPPTPGIDGYKVSGQPIEARGGKALGLVPDEGCELDSLDPHLLVASQSGIPILNGQHLRVDRLDTISPDEPLAPFYLHSILIEGDLPDETRLRCCGHIILTGSVSGGELVAEGDLVIRGAVSGPIWLQSSGNMHLRSALNALIHCGQSLRLGQELVHSRAFVAGELHAETAMVRGGGLHCLKGAVIRELGSPQGDHTLLQLGQTAYFLERIYSLQAESQDLKRLLEEVLRSLIRQRSVSGVSAETLALQQQQRALLYRDHSLRAELEVLTRLLDQDALSEAVVSGTLHQAVRLEANDQVQTIQSSRLGVYLSCSASQALSIRDLAPPAETLVA